MRPRGLDCLTLEGTGVNRSLTVTAYKGCSINAQEEANR